MNFAKENTHLVSLNALGIQRTCQEVVKLLLTFNPIQSTRQAPPHLKTNTANQHTTLPDQISAALNGWF